MFLFSIFSPSILLLKKHSMITVEANPIPYFAISNLYYLSLVFESASILFKTLSQISAIRGASILMKSKLKTSVSTFLFFFHVSPSLNTSPYPVTMLIDSVPEISFGDVSACSFK
jgi:hypothetical protein